MKAIYYVIFLCILLYACQQEEKETSTEEPPVVEVLTEDSAMNAAILEAHQTLDTFNHALNSHNPNYDYFALKVLFPTPTGNEHLWVSDIVLTNGKYRGVINNVPEQTKEVDIGDTILIDNSRISDWMFVEAGKLHGGYTVRLLRNRMTEEEKNAFDRENGLIMEE